MHDFLSRHVDRLMGARYAAPVAPPFAYYGGKMRLAPRIAGMFPDHGHYVEPFAGSLSVLLSKPRSRMETVNDLDGDLMLFWRILRDEPEALIDACAATPHSRGEFLAARNLEEASNELERARRVWVLLSQARTGTLRPSGWRHYQDPGVSSTSMPGYLAGYVRRMRHVAERLTGVSLECRPALDVIRSYGRHRHTLLYVDPPYMADSRNSTGYRHEMGDQAAHRSLAQALQECRATVVLSGYPSALYDEDLYPGWDRVEIDATTTQGTQSATRTEVLWCNRMLPKTQLHSNRPLLDFPRDETLFDMAESDESGARGGGRCAQCDRTLTPRPTGRPARYCSPACRQHAYRSTRAAAASGSPAP